MKSRLIIVSIIALSILDLSCNSSRDRGNPTGYINVIKVVDGDTFWADDGSEKGSIKNLSWLIPEGKNL